MMTTVGAKRAGTADNTVGTATGVTQTKTIHTGPKFPIWVLFTEFGVAGGGQR